MNTTTEHVRELRARRRELSSQLEALDKYLESLTGTAPSPNGSKSRAGRGMEVPKRFTRNTEELLEQLRELFAEREILTQYEAVRALDTGTNGSLPRLFAYLEREGEIKRLSVLRRPEGASKKLPQWRAENLNRELRVSAGNGAEQGRKR